MLLIELDFICDRSDDVHNDFHGNVTEIKLNSKRKLKQ